MRGCDVVRVTLSSITRAKAIRTVFPIKSKSLTSDLADFAVVAEVGANCRAARAARLTGCDKGEIVMARIGYYSVLCSIAPRRKVPAIRINRD